MVVTLITRRMIGIFIMSLSKEEETKVQRVRRGLLAQGHTAG